MLKALSVFTFPGGQQASISEVGGKGYSLIKSAESGLPVPPGFVLPVDFFRPWLNRLKSTTHWTHFVSARPDELQAVCNALKQATSNFAFDSEQSQAVTESLSKFQADSLFAVRSSSPEEDLEGASFAGGYETILGTTKSTIEDAVRRAFASCLDYRVALYKREHGFDVSDPKIAVVIQKQIASDVAGVGFSINPLTNNFDEAVFNANFGLGETVVGGLATPDTYKVDKVTRIVVEKQLGAKETSIWLGTAGGTTESPSPNRTQLCLTDSQILELADLIARVEQLYGKPIDTEWAFEHGKLYLLQARPITALIPVAENLKTEPGERKQLFVDMTIIVQGLYKPMSPMGTWTIRTLLARASTHLLGASILREPHDSVLIVEHGRIYANASNIMALFGKEEFARFIANVDPITSEVLLEADDSYLSERDAFHHPPFHLIMKLPEIAAHLLEARLLPEHAHKAAQREIATFMDSLQERALKPEPVYDKAEDLLGEAFKFIIKTSAPLFAASRLAFRSLKELLLPQDDSLLNKLERALPNNVTTEMGLALYHLSQLAPNSTRFAQEWREFMKLYGHRGPIEFDIASPRYREEPQLLLDQIETLRQSATMDDNPQLRFDRAQVERHEALEELAERVHQRSGWLQFKRFQSLYRVYETLGGYREIHKYLLIFALDQLRTQILQHANELIKHGKLDNASQVFDLTMDDLRAEASEPGYDLQAARIRNKAFSNKLAAVPILPPLFDSRGRILRPVPAPPREGEVVGTPISPGVSRGRIKVLHEADEKPLLRGEILVARATDPGWTPLFVNASAVILEIGGMLQHGALVAREYGLPCVSGIANATSLWTDGTLVEVDGSAGVIRVIAE
ncbi:MAG: hypothetical protein K2W95_16140 [Candidatus Obscuribacterales bacterium]|nr:hypothetical protein [Candidatus Obscuribacterales bacterium]